MSVAQWSIIFSRESLWDSTQNAPFPKMQETINELTAKKISCYLFSNRTRPNWLHNYPQVQFISCQRQKANKAREEILKQGRVPEKTLVVSCVHEDLIMSVQSKLLAIVAGWTLALDSKTEIYGLKFYNPEDLPKVMEILNVSYPWYYEYEDHNFKIYSLTNAGGSYNIQEMTPVVEMLTGHLKSGNKYLEQAFQLLFLSSLISTPIAQEVDYWTYFPASSLKTPEEEIIARYVDLARYAFKKRGKEQMLFRHTPSQKRHVNSGIDRSNPNLQIATLKVNEYYKDKIKGKTVAVIDDFTTYGTSFGVAETILKQAGAEKVFCFSMGKFGKTLFKYNIELGETNPFAPMGNNYPYTKERASGNHSTFALQELCSKIGSLI